MTEVGVTSILSIWSNIIHTEIYKTECCEAMQRESDGGGGFREYFCSN